MIADDYLKELRNLVGDLVRSIDAHGEIGMGDADAVSRLCDVFIALDWHLTDGGEKPKPWR